MSSTGELLKMQIVAYDDDSFSSATGPDYVYEVLINPDSYALTYASIINDKSTQGSSESTVTQNKRAPQTVTFKFLFDGTGVIQRGGGGLLSGLAVPGLPTNKPDVMQDYEKFKSVVYQYGSDTHQPRYVQLQWGSLMYNCQMINMTITFKLFNPDGTPLRAEANCTFQSVINETTLAAIENRQSPDLTHVRTVGAGDTLPLLCYKEYGDSRYYYQIAQFNRLTDFKKLIPGAKIIFPPITTS